jgi:hypothetical protein
MMGSSGNDDALLAPSESSHLLQIPPPRDPANPHSRPPKLGHHLRKSPVRPGPPPFLGHVQNVENQLGGNAFGAVVTDLTV